MKVALQTLAVGLLCSIFLVPVAQGNDDGPTLTFLDGSARSNTSTPISRSHAWGLSLGNVKLFGGQSFVFSYLNEAHQLDHFGEMHKRDGLAVQRVWTIPLTKHFRASGVFGPYVTTDTRSTGEKTYEIDYRLNALAGAKLEYDLFLNMSVVFSFDRVLTWKKLDGDLFFLGLTYRFQSL